MKFKPGCIYFQRCAGFWVVWQATYYDGRIMLGTVLVTNNPLLRQSWYGAPHETHREISEEELMMYRLQGEGT